MLSLCADSSVPGASKESKNIPADLVKAKQKKENKTHLNCRQSGISVLSNPTTVRSGTVRFILFVVSLYQVFIQQSWCLCAVIFFLQQKAGG